MSLTGHQFLVHESLVITLFNPENSSEKQTNSIFNMTVALNSNPLSDFFLTPQISYQWPPEMTKKIIL